MPPADPSTTPTGGGGESALDRLDATLDRMAQSLERVFERIASANEKMTEALEAIGNTVEQLGKTWQQFSRTILVVAGPLRTAHFAAKLLGTTLGGLARAAAAAIAPLLALAGVIAAVLAVALLAAAAIAALIRSGRKIDEVAKSARFAGLTVGEAFGQKLLGDLAGIGDEIDNLRRGFVDLIRAANSGDIRAAAVLSQFQLTEEDLKGVRTEAELFAVAVERSNQVSFDALAQQFGNEGARRWREIARSVTDTSRELSTRQFDTSGSERLTSSLTETSAILRSIKMQFSTLFEGPREELAAWIERINKGLLRWERRLERINNLQRQIRILNQARQGRFTSVMQMAQEMQQNLSLQPLLAFNQGQAAVTIEQGGLSAVQGALRQESMLAVLKTNEQNTAKAAEHLGVIASRDNVIDQNAGENVQHQWDTGPTGLLPARSFGRTLRRVAQ